MKCSSLSVQGGGFCRCLYLYRRLGSDGLKFTTLLQVRLGSRTTTTLDSRLRGNDECVLDRHCAAGFGAAVVGDVSGQGTDHLAAESVD